MEKTFGKQYVLYNNYVGRDRTRFTLIERFPGLV